MSDRPAVRVNQVGYLPSGPKSATLVSAAAEPVDFTVIDAQGRTAYAGRSRPWPVHPEPTSGQDVHTVDFTPLTATGRAGLRPAGVELRRLVRRRRPRPTTEGPSAAGRTTTTT